MEIINLNNAQKVSFKIDGYKMFSSDKIEIIRLKLDPREILEPHANPNDVIFYVVDGEGTFSNNQEETIIKKDSCFRILKNEIRGWKNINNKDLVILVIKLL